MLASAAGALRAGGARMVDARPDVVLPDVVRTYQQLLYPILLGTMRKRAFDGFVALADFLAEDDDGPLARTARFATLRHRDWLFANEKREQLRALMADFFRDVDALLMPVAIVPAIPHDHSEPFPERVIRVNGGEPALHRPVRLDRAGHAGLPARHRRAGRAHGAGSAGRHPDRRALSGGPHHARRRRAVSRNCSAGSCRRQGCERYSLCRAKVQNWVPGGPPKQPTS